MVMIPTVALFIDEFGVFFGKEKFRPPVGNFTRYTLGNKCYKTRLTRELTYKYIFSSIYRVGQQRVCQVGEQSSASGKDPSWDKFKEHALNTGKQVSLVQGSKIRLYVHSQHCYRALIVYSVHPPHPGGLSSSENGKKVSCCLRAVGYL